MTFDPQGPAPLLNRAWPRRGWASPPFFGRSVPPLMAETEITFKRQTIAPDAIGGWGPSGTPVVIWTVNAHVEHFEEQRPRLTGDNTEEIAGVTVYHHYEVYTPLPPSPAQMPQKGDWLYFNDGTGEFHIPVMHVELNSGLLDHLEIWTDQFE